MREFPNERIPFNLIHNTPTEYPLCEDEQDALLYLKLLLDKDFLYLNWLNYDIIDYEKIIYIEMNFSNNEEIKSLLDVLKTNISNNYITKNNYLNRIKSNIINIDTINRKSHAAEIHLPKEWLEGLE